MPRVAATRQPRSGTAWRALAIDTCFARCAVALAQEPIGGSIVVAASLSQEMTRGHAALLTPMIEQALRQAGWRASDLDLVALTIGPGSFTGVRIGVAMARGLAMTLRCPIAGILTTDALRLGAAPQDREGTMVIGIESGRGDYFLAIDGAPPFSGTAAALVTQLKDRSSILIGDGARTLADELRRLGGRAEIGVSASFVDPAILATHALTVGIGRWAAANARDGLPRPVYLRGADVTLPDGARTTADLKS